MLRVSGIEVQESSCIVVSKISNQGDKQRSHKQSINFNKGGKFLKKLWCCVGGKVLQGNLALSTDLIM